MKITVDLAANTAKFNSEFKRAEQTAKDRMGNITEAAKRAGVAIGAALAAGATVAAVAIKSAIDRMDSISKTAQKIGIATEALSGLEYAARLSDVSLEQLGGGVLRLTKNLGEAAAGNKLLAGSFAAIGVATTGVDGSLRKTEDVLGDLADVFKALPDGAEKSKLAVDIFGRSGAQLIPLLNAGRDGLNEMTDEARKLGLVFDKEAGQQAEQFNDTLTSVKAGLEGAAGEIAITLLPKLSEMADLLQSEAFRNGFGAIIEGAANSALKIAELVSGLGNLTKFVAEEAAARVNGASIDDPVRVADEVSRQRERVDFMRGGLMNRLMGTDDTAPGIAAALVELERLEEKLRVATAAAEENAIAEQTRSAASTEAAAATNESALSGDALIAALVKLREEQAAEAASAAASTAAQRARAKAMQDAQKAMDSAVRAAAAANQRASAATAGLNQLLRQQAAAMGGPIVQASHAYAAELEYITELERELTETGAMSGPIQAALATAREQANKQWIDDLDAIAEAGDEAGRYLQDLVDALSETPLDRMTADAEKLGEALEEAFAGRGKHSVEELQEAINNLNSQMGTGLVDSSLAALRGMQSLASSGSNAFKVMQVAIDALALVQGISAILNQGTGDPYSAPLRMAAMAAAIAPLIANLAGSIGSFGGGGGFSDTAAERQETQGRGTVLGDAEAQSQSILNSLEITADATTALVGINRGMLVALQTLQGGIDRAGGMLARGAGDVDFSAVEVRISSFGSLFGGSSRVTDQGLTLGGGSLGDIGVQAYQEQQSRRSIFASRRTREDVSPVSDAVESQFQLIIDSIVDTVRAAAEALGLLPADVQSRLDAFALEVTRISLKDLTAEEQQAELLAVFSTIFDNIAGSVVPFIEQFQQLGEGLGETLVRVATGVQVTQEGLRRLGFSLDGLNPERFAQVSEALIEMVGGLDAFIEGMQTFVARFAPEAHQFALLQDDLNRAFEQTGLVLPATREAMWGLMQSLDATTESGRAQIATLLRLAGTADQYYSMLEDGQGTELEDRREHLQNLLDANREYYDFAERIAAQFLQSVGSELNNSLVEIEREYRRNIQTAGELARAAGMSGAAVQELSRIELIAARRRAEAIRLTEESARTTAGELGLTELSQIEAQIAAFQDSAQGMQDAMGGISDAFDEAAQRARNTIELLIGDLSPLRDQEKLQIALQGLSAGTVSADQVLQIGRRLYASGADYRTLFDQVLQIQSTAPISGGPSPSIGGGGGPAPVNPELLELIARRDEMLADQSAVQARTNALDLVEQIGELASIQGITFDAVAQNLGISLDGLAELLGVDGETLVEMLQRQSEEASEEREAVLEIPERFSDAVLPITVELQTLVTLAYDQIRTLEEIRTNTGRTAGAAESSAETVANRDLTETSLAPRSTRIGMGSGGFDGRGIEQRIFQR